MAALDHWIDREIEIDFPIPKGIQEYIDQLELLEPLQDWAYFAYLDGLDVACKHACYKGLITQKQWDLLWRKYYGGV